MVRYYTDSPIESSNDDLFDRKKFAQNIADVIVSQPVDEKYVIGLYSPWGYGKTSVLNMTEEALKNKAVVVRYNPWVYSDAKSMTIGLLSSIGNAVMKKTKPDEHQFMRWIQIKKISWC